METFTQPKAMVENPDYSRQRRAALAGLSNDMIDAPIVGLINAFNALPFCFTLQCCFGHFVYEGQNDPQNLTPLPVTDAITAVEYRIAYLCLCVEYSRKGRALLDEFKDVAHIDPQYIQFGCADWFWQRQVNSYALQVEPDRFKDQDTAVFDYREALHVEKVRNLFFSRLNELIGVQTIVIL